MRTPTCTPTFVTRVLTPRPGGLGPAVARVLLVLLLAITLLPALAPQPALAQPDLFFFLRPPANIPQAPPPKRNNNGWWPGSLFQPQQPARPQPEAPRQQAAPKRREPPAEPQGSVYATAEAASRGRRQPPTQFALVLGDRMGEQLAQGLADATVADRSRLAILAQTEDDSGYLPSPTDWLAKAPSAISAAQANVIILVLGTEDLKPIRDGGSELEPLSERWIEAYSRRIDSVLASARQKTRGVIVVGLAPVADAERSADYAKLNDIVRVRAARAGLPFVNVWDGFVDEDGNFLSTGPAVDGQRRRLRYNDGVRFTRAGGRKLAFFVQQDLNRLLEDTTQPSSSSDSGAVAASLAGGPENGGAPAAGTKLIAVSGAGQSAAQALKDGVLPPAMRGRADDFSWPPPSEAPAATPAH